MACSDYGFGASGFVRKPFTNILNELWADAQSNDSNLVRDDKSPQGQIISLMANATDEMWQLFQGLTSNCDISQAEGCQLDKLAQLTGQARFPDETDTAFRQRILGVSVGGGTVLNSLYSAVYGIDGVTCVKINVNDTGATVNGLPPHSYEVVVLGGDDAEIAETIWSQHPAGITLFGNTTFDVATQLDCQTVSFTRPVEVPICLEVELKAISDDCGCSESDIQAIKDALVAVFDADCPKCRFGIGNDVVLNSLFEPFYSQFSGFIVQSLLINGATDDVVIAHDEIPVLDCDCTSIVFV